ncbi:MAG: hypothetical protein HGB21_11605 [Nitrospirae bacterium]|nr:hypothetical protein [Nitrospirota bacterium]NTW66930.1 hypothetical protein [Nitrospirota bacterium]
MLGLLGAIWGLGGVLALLLSACLRLWPKAVDAFTQPFAWYHWVSLVVVVLGMAYAEGYKGFQKAFSPRTAARARHLRQNPRIDHVILAPFFCMGYFHATRRRKITSISLTLGIIVLIVMVGFVSQPWRGIIDAGVVLGLGWGIISLIIFSIQAFGAGEFGYSPEVPTKDG